MTTLCRCSHRWQAYRAQKQYAGAVLYELKAFDGSEVHVPFEPRVVYDEAAEPMPWTLVF